MVLRCSNKGKTEFIFEHHVEVLKVLRVNWVSLTGFFFLNDCRCEDLVLAYIFQIPEFGTRLNGS